MKLLIALLIFSVNSTFADSLLVMQTFDKKAQNEIYIKGDSLRFVIKNVQAIKRISLFSNSTKNLKILNPKNHSFLVLDQAFINKQKKQMAQQIKFMTEQMRSKMSSLSPERKKQVQESLGKIDLKTGKIKAPEIEFKTTGKYSKVSGYVCQKVNVFIAGELSKELCLADAESLNMDNKEFNTLTSFFEFMKKSYALIPESKIPAISGIPIATKDFKGQQSSGLTSITHESLSDDLFKVPETYRQEKLK